MSVDTRTPEAASAVPPGVARPGAGSATLSVLMRIVRFLLPLVLATLIVLLLWVLFLRVFPQIGPRIGKSPLDVWNFLFGGKGLASDRAQVWSDLWITLRDAAVGFVAGMTAAAVVSAVFTLSRPVSQTFMPLAMLLRSVPLVAMTPLIVLIFGRGTASVAVIGGIVVFFPALVMIMTGLRSGSRQAQELVVAYGGGRWTALRMVSIPSALPSIFAAARVSVPGALIGALLAEWLGTGTGLGSSLIKSIPRYAYNELWASIVVVTAASIILYAFVGVLESFVLARYGPNAGRR